jgi:cytochrome c-type biogenesis protein CcmE
MSQTSNKYVKFCVAITVIVLALVWVGYTGVQENKSYYVTIKELRAEQGKGDAVYAKHLRVAGNVQPGSIRQSGTTADFVMVEEGQTLRVAYKGSEPVPDTFKDDAQALAIGSFGRDGVFHANEVQAKCASKYAPKPGTAAPPQASQPQASQPQSKGY